ncbi:fimbrial protein [Erwinia amylovora]
MYKFNCIAGVVALGVVAGHAMAATPAGQGTVTFNGTLTANTCVIDGDVDQTVTLPTLSVKTLATAGNEAGSKNFDIKVKECDASKVATHFEAIGSSGVDATTGNLTNSLTGDEAATKVEIRLYNPDGTQIRAGDTGKEYTVDSTAKTATMTYVGGYYATGQSTAGNVAAKIVYTIAYP